MKRTIVIKLGRSIATTKHNKLDLFRIEQLAKQIKLLQEYDITIIVVISAAVCCGEQTLGLKQDHAVSKQLVAGVGQAVVTAKLCTIFAKHNLTMAQLLLTKDDLKDKQRQDRIKTILQHASEQNITLIVNENDIVELYNFGGNDNLAAEIACLSQADNLLILTDVEGVMDQNLEVIKTYTKVNKIGQIKKINHKGEVGGIHGKIAAAIYAAEHGVTPWIACGKTKNILEKLILQNQHIGTKVLGRTI